MRAGAFFFIFALFLCLPVLLFAQDEGNEPDFETDWDDYDEELYTSGDQTLSISLGVIFPTVFVNNGKVLTSPNEHKFDPPVGGTGSIAFNYYLSSLFFVGGEVGGIFSPTVAKNTVFFIMLGARGGIQFNIWRFEFPFSFTVGMYWQTYLNQGYYGLYLRGGGAVYFRATPSWSFGLTTNWYWFPQRTDDRAKNVDGNFIDLMLTARYHF